MGKKTVLSPGFVKTLTESAERPNSYPDNHRISHALYGILELGEALARIEKKIDALTSNQKRDS